MKRHSLDLTSLVSGAIFVAVGTIYLLDLNSDYSVRPRWVAAFVLIGIGLAGLLSTVTAGRRWDATVEAAATAPTAGSPDEYTTMPADSGWPSDRNDPTHSSDTAHSGRTADNARD